MVKVKTADYFQLALSDFANLSFLISAPENVEPDSLPENREVPPKFLHCS